MGGILGIVDLIWSYFIYVALLGFLFYFLISFALHTIASKYNKNIEFLPFIVPIYRYYKVLTLIGGNNLIIIGMSANLIIIFSITSLFFGNLLLIPLLGIHGAAWSTVLGFAVAALLNILHIYRNVGPFISFGQHLIKPLVSAFLMGVALFEMQRRFLQALPDFTSLMIQTLLGLLVYITILLWTKALSKPDWEVFIKKQ